MVQKDLVDSRALFEVPLHVLEHDKILYSCHQLCKLQLGMTDSIPFVGPFRIKPQTFAGGNPYDSQRRAHAGSCTSRVTLRLQRRINELIYDMMLPPSLKELGIKIGMIYVF